MQREFMKECKPEVGQSIVLKALASLKQAREEEMSAYIKRFDLMYKRFVSTIFNDNTLKQFFIQGFFKAGTIWEVLERNPQTLTNAKIAAMEMKHIDKDYDRLWQKENELILQFILIRRWILEKESRRNESQAPQPFSDSGPSPSVVSEPILLSALHAPQVDPHFEDVERMLGASQLGFQKAMMKQIQSLTD